MPTINQVTLNSPVTLGSPSTVVIDSEATSGGALTGELNLSSSNDVFFSPGELKTHPVAANGSSSYTLIRSPGPSLRSPQSVKIFTRVREAGVNLPALDISLVNLSP